MAGEILELKRLEQDNCELKQQLTASQQEIQASAVQLTKQRSKIQDLEKKITSQEDLVASLQLESKGRPSSTTNGNGNGGGGDPGRMRPEDTVLRSKLKR